MGGLERIEKRRRTDMRSAVWRQIPLDFDLLLAALKRG
jgi:hypothetical protein